MITELRSRLLARGKRESVERRPGLGPCLVFVGATVNGYGKLSVNHRMWLAHRLAYKLFTGRIRSRMYVLHSCDNKPCFEPSHLFVGTQQDNLNDAISKGRIARGDLHGLKKHPERIARGAKSSLRLHPRSLFVPFSFSDVQDIRRSYRTGASQRQLAKERGVCTAT